MLLITILMLLAAVTGGITKVTNAPELLIVSRALVGLHCGKKEFLFLISNAQMNCNIINHHSFLHLIV